MNIPQSTARIPRLALLLVAAAFLCAAPRARAVDYGWIGPGGDIDDGNWNTTETNWVASGGGGLPVPWVNGNNASFGLHPSYVVVRITLTENISAAAMFVDASLYLFQSAAGITLNADSIFPPFGGIVAFEGNLEVVADNGFVFNSSFGEVYFEENTRLTASAADAIRDVNMQVRNNAQVVLTAAGAMSGGQAQFSGTTTLLVAASGGLIGGTQFFFGDSTLSLGATGAVDGGEITLYGESLINVLEANALTANSDVTFGTSGGTGGTIRLNGLSTTLGRVFSATGSGGVIENGIGIATLTLGNGLDSLFAGQIRNGAAGTLALVKTGSGSLTLTGSNTYTGGTTVKSGTLAVDGGSITHTGTNIVVGDASGDNGALVLTNGARVEVASGIVGNAGVGLLRVESGATLLSSGTNSYAAYQSSGTANVTVTGSNAVWQSFDELVIARGGHATLLVEDGGLVTGLTTTLGDLAGATAEATVTGTGSELRGPGGLMVGNNGQATLRLEDGGRAISAYARVGYNTGSYGEVTVTGTGSELDLKPEFLITYGTLLVGGGGEGLLRVEDGGAVTHLDSLQVGTGMGGYGEVVLTGEGSRIDVNLNLLVGTFGTGIVTINGGVLTSLNATLGADPSGVGTITVNSGTWQHANDIYVGNFGAGILNINGGVVTNGDAFIAYDAASSGTATVTGGVWTNTGNLTVGVSGTATLNITGGVVSNADGIIAENAGSVGRATVSSGTWASSNSLTVGDSGTGTLNLTGAGVVTSGSVSLARNAGSSGTLNIGAFDLTTTGGTLTAASVVFGDGAGVINFNQTNAVTFGADISGNGSINQRGSGVTTLTEANTYTGGSTITNGVLQTVGASALGAGPVALNGGSLAPVGTLTIASLDWMGGTIASALGTVTSLVEITGNLALTGTGLFDFMTGGGFLGNTPYAILSAANLGGFSIGDFAGNPIGVVAPTFTIVGDTLFVSYNGAFTGPVIDNTFPYFTPVNADFVLNGPVITGDTWENNTVNSLTFNPGSSLQVFNNLTVTSGDFNVSTGSAVINGGNVLVPGSFNLNGPGTLIAGSNFAIGGDANINGGSLLINGLFTAGGDMNVNSTVTVNGSASLGGNLNTNASLVTVNGSFALGGSANLNNGTELIVNSGGQMTAGQAVNINFGSSAVINGQLASPQVNVNGGGLLQGSGLIAGNVWNNGVVAPGNSPGTLSIAGNYTQTGNGLLQIEPGDLLWVSGNAALGGTLQVVGGKFQYGQQIIFLQAGSISGEFDEILMPNPSRYRGRFLTERGTGLLLVAPTSYTLVAETTNQKNVAKALDSFIPAQGNDRETVSIALDLQSAEQYPAAFDAIAPTYYESLGNIVIEQAFVQTQQLNQRLSSVRLGARGFQAIGIESPLRHDKDGKSVLESKDIVPQSAIHDPQWNLWAMGNGLFGKATTVSQVPDYRFDSGGFLVGADYRWSENFAAGVYTGYQYTWADYSGAGNTQINSALFGGYASYTQGGLYADAVVGGGYNGYRVRRSIAFSTIDRTARSQPNGGQFNAALNLGYDWEVGKFTLGPIAGVQYTYAGVAAFTEDGAESLNLRVAQQNINSLRTTFGGRIAYTWNVSETIAIIPEVRMFWQHEFLNNPRNINSSLDGGAGPTFGYETSAPARDSVFAGAGVSAQFSERWNAFFFYNIDFGRQGYFGNYISGGLNWKF